MGTTQQVPARPPAEDLIPVEVIERRILVLRGHRVMLDRDLAELYGVQPKRLNEQVKRNRDRFPEDFMFQLTLEEGKAVMLSRSQSATLNRGENVKYRPYVFTEHGAVMLANVLRSPVAVRAGLSAKPRMLP
jgi:hypothetical protein